MTNKFIPKSKMAEFKMLLADDDSYTQTKTYLAPRIELALNKFEFSDEAHKDLVNKLEQDIEIAAKRFLKNKKNWETLPYRFSTYFSWYIAQRVNPLNPKRKRAFHL